jgi:SMC interacting uncharacterized protein involved in chromosome segregation
MAFIRLSTPGQNSMQTSGQNSTRANNPSINGKSIKPNGWQMLNSTALAGSVHLKIDPDRNHSQQLARARKFCQAIPRKNAPTMPGKVPIFSKNGVFVQALSNSF